MNKNIINDGTHSQFSGTHKDHGPWVPGTHKEVNNFESLGEYSEISTMINQHWLRKWFCAVKQKEPPTGQWQVDGLVQERRNSIANALELRLSCNKPSKCTQHSIMSALIGNQRLGTTVKSLI